MVRTLLAGVLFATVALAAPVPKDFKKPPKLDGQWQVTAYETNGRATKSAAILSQTWAINGETLAITRTTAAKGAGAGPTTKLALKTDPKKSPMELDYTLASGTTRLGVFAIDGDTLTVCLPLNFDSVERPANLDGGPNVVKYTFTRTKDK